MRSPIRTVRRPNNPLVRWDAFGYTLEMLRGMKVGLRGRIEADVAILEAELYDDVATRSRADTRPWVPRPPGLASSPYAVREPADDSACFSVVALEDHEYLAGETLLWGIDLHNRSAHVGISLLPQFRGQRLSVEVLHLLCRYGFVVRGLHRLQVETLVDNAPMLAAAARLGFERDGVLRGAAWANGQFTDEAVLGLLASDWSDS
jgi:RimJ/RimL family protein N-acetyltransferase